MSSPMLASSRHRAIEPPSRQSIEPASSLHRATASSQHRAFSIEHRVRGSAFHMGQQHYLHRHFAVRRRFACVALVVTHISRRFGRRYACVALVVTHVSRTFCEVSQTFCGSVFRLSRCVHSKRYARFTNVSQVFRGQYDTHCESVSRTSRP